MQIKIRPTRPHRLWPRLVCVVLLALGYLAPVAASVPAAPLDQTCNPRPPVTVTVTPSADGRLLASFTATTNGAVTSNQITELRFSSTDGALVDIPGGLTGGSGTFVHPLTPPVAQTSIYVRRPASSGSATVHLRVVDACGEWPTFVGGGQTGFPTSTPTTGGPPTATRTPTATPTVKVASLGAALSSLILPSPQPASWSNIPSPTQFDWIGVFRAGAADRDYIDSPRFTSAQPAGTAIIPMPPDLDAGSYELRLFSNKTTDNRLAISNQFSVLRTPGTVTLTPTPGVPPTPVVAPAQAPDTVGDVGQHASLRLDKWRASDTVPPRDIPVIAYYDLTNTNLKILRCSNPACSGSQSPITVDASGNVGQYASLQLDNRIDPGDFGFPQNPFFFPVVSYYESLGATTGRLKVLHCINLDCSGGGHSIRIADVSSPNVGLYTSLALDTAGNPVVSYHDATNGDLKILRCGDVNCSAGNSIATPDSAGNVGLFTSIALAPGNIPVVSYFDATNNALKVLRCGNSNCSSGNTIAFVDAVGMVGQHTSLFLDQAGKPVITYFDVLNQRLKIAHCNDIFCTNASILVPDAFTSLGQFTSLALDNAGYPVVAYHDAANGGRLKVLRCTTPGCTSNSTIFVSDAGSVGQFTSLHLNGLNNPVISYYDVGNGNLKVQHCSSPACITAPDGSGSPPSAEINTHNVGQFTSLRMDGSGNPVISYYDENSTALKLVRCGNQSCSLIANPDFLRVDLDGGQSTSLALDSLGRPVVSYVSSSSRLRLAHCGDANCDPANVVFSTPDVSGAVGRTQGTSLTLDASGNPVISYFDQAANRLRVMHCTNANCSGSQTSTTPDTLATGGQQSSLKLDASGRPVISYYEASNGGRLRIIRCGNVNCTGPSASHSIQTPDPSPNAGLYTSLALDTAGNPVVSYYEAANGGRLKLLHCVNADCSGAGHSIAVVDSATVGEFTSVAIDTRINPATSQPFNVPVISYYDAGNKNMKIVRCGNPNCTSGNVIRNADTAGDVGKFTSVALDPATGNPFVSYYDETNADLRMYRCRTPTCE
jgi:hypothetical protein